MAVLIKGQDVVLHIANQIGVNSLGEPVMDYSDSVTVNNVLIEPVINEELTADSELYGKHTAYQLHIPKADTHKWEDTFVDFYGCRWRTKGELSIYDPNLTPLSWKGKIGVEKYE